MANTATIEAMSDGTRKITIHSGGERDMSARVSQAELDTMVARAHNDDARGVYADKPQPE